MQLGPRRKMLAKLQGSSCSRTTLECSGKVRWNIGMEAQLDTAGKLGLGDGMYVLSPFAGFSWRFCKRAKLTASFKYNQSIATQEDVSERQTFEFKPGLEINLPGRWCSYVEYAPKWDLAKGAALGSFKILQCPRSSSRWAVRGSNTSDW